MGASVKPNCWRSASFLLCTWSAVCALWGAVKCHGVDDCDLTLVSDCLCCEEAFHGWWQVIIVLFAVAVPLGVAMWFLNRPRAKRLSPQVLQHIFGTPNQLLICVQGLFEDNAAVKALTSSALVETDDRKAGLALIEAIRNAKRGGTSMVMDLFASSTVSARKKHSVCLTVVAPGQGFSCNAQGW